MRKNSSSFHCNFFSVHRLGPQWTEDVCYRSPFKEIGRLPDLKRSEAASTTTKALSVTPTIPLLPKKLKADPARRDSGLSTGSSEPETVSAETSATVAGSANVDLSDWWAPRIKANLADLLPGSHCRFVFRFLL